MLLATAEFIDKGIPLNQFFVTEVNRYEYDRAFGILDVGVHGHRQHAALWRQQSSRAATPAFNEVLDRITAQQDLVQVGIEYSSIQAISFKAAAQEKRTATPQNRADDW